MEESVRKLLNQFCNNTKSKLTEFTFNQDFNFICDFRTAYNENEKCPPSEFCDKIITEFGDITCTNWIVRYSFPNTQRLKYRKVYVCQHSSHGKTVKRKRNDTRIRDKNCKAQIDIKIKITTRNSIRKDSLLKEGLNTIIKVKYQHSHRVNVAEAYSFLRMTKEVETKFIGYFEDGMGPAAAKAFHEVLLLESSNFQETLANAKLNPTDRQIKHLYNKWRTDNFGTRSEDSVFEVLCKNKAALEAKGAKIILKDNPLIIVILTPIMRRTHFHKFSKEIVFVDSSGSCDQMNTCVTFMYTATKVGAVPLACILHTSQSESNYTLAFNTLKEHLGTEGFGGLGYPLVFMTDDSPSERNALNSVFPSSHLLLCLFHLAQAFWRWLWASNNGISKEHRKPIMKMFQAVIYSSCIEEAEYEYNKILNDERCKKYPFLLSHIASIWKRRLEWCLCLRKDFITRGNNTNNYVEASIRIFKDIVLQRCKAFNGCALVEFIVTVFESYHQKHLLEFANSRRSQPKLLYLKFSQKAKDLNVYQIDAQTFRVCSANDRHLFYTVYTDIALCDCPFGVGGRFCKHLCAVQEQFSLVIDTSPLLNYDDRVLLAKLALGNEANVNFYNNMDITTKCNESISCTQYNIGMMDLNENENPIELKEIKNDDASSINNLCVQETVALKNNFIRILDIAAKNPTPDLIETMHKINITLNKVQSATEVQSCIINIAGKLKKRYGRQIGVQPTSKARRKTRDGLKSGSKRIQSGRPSNVENKRMPKKKRNLSININKNTPNAKVH